MNLKNKRIELTKGKFTLVDDDMFDYLSQWKWCVTNGYACRKYKNKDIKMHRVINNTPDGLETDHINRNKLDNRRINLRSVTRRENSINHGLQRNNTSGHRGISYQEKYKSWRSYIKINSKQIHLGNYKNYEEAIKARKKAELKFGFVYYEGVILG